jgi:hypothetical protein
VSTVSGNDQLSISGVDHTTYVVGGLGGDQLRVSTAHRVMVIGDLAMVQVDTPFIIDSFANVVITTIVTNRSNNHMDDMIDITLSTDYHSSTSDSNITMAIVMAGGGHDYISVRGAGSAHICADDCACNEAIHFLITNYLLTRSF